MRYAVLIVLFSSFLALQTRAQSGNVYRASIEANDTIAQIDLRTVRVVSQRTWKDVRQRKRFLKLQKKVKKVYPYARLAAVKLEEYAQELEEVESEKEKKEFYRAIEAELKEEFEGELRKLTISEGRILIKLIDRETGNTSYTLVKDLRGKFSAFFWQSLARVFGHNLKSNYDPLGEDRNIEYIVQQIERKGV
ncbi:MAG TPA: DUF4294 domain-containing protein [Flavobacteriales bacterium]|jgi:hypothetical protein|nr:DUF4294 domain-containing protein [Flavobacteriales bacterium]